MTHQETQNRRQHKRVIVSQPATITTVDENYTGRILNISAGGAGISLDVQLKDNSRITVNIEDLGLIPARVVRNMKEGVGVKFEISEEKEKRFIEQITQIIERKRLQATQNIA